MLGGASAPAPATAEADAPVTARPPLDLNFVTEAVQGGRWAEWGEKFSNLEDLAARMSQHLQPGQRVRRLAIAAYSADHTSGFISFDIGFGNRERIDGLNLNPIRPEVVAKLELLKPMLEPGGLIELRVCGMGQGDHGRRALQALADTLGVAARGPADKSAALSPGLGLVLDWVTAFPKSWRMTPVRSNWLETWPGGIRTVEPAYIPVPRAEPRQLPVAPANGSGDLHFATRPAAPWLPGVPMVAGIRDLVDQALAAIGPEGRLKRLTITTHTSAPYDGYISFDAEDAESIDGSIREQPGYSHLQVMVAEVRSELERLRPRLTAEAVVEFRAAGFGSGESGWRAMRVVADLLGVEVRAAVSSIADLRASGGLVTHWRSVFPTASGQQPLESSWREITQPPVHGAWVPVEAWAYAPIRGLNAPLPERNRPAAEPEPDLEPAEPASSGQVTSLAVLCAGCGRVMDEAAGTPLRARTPCPTCGSRARRQELVAGRQQRPTLIRRLRSIF